MHRGVLIALCLFALAAPATAQQLDDETMAKLVVREVVSYPQFSIFDDVNIGVNDGEVVVSGRVTMPFKRDAIVERIAAIAGVREVVNRIEVLPASLSDTRLRRQVAQAIYTHPSFWHYGSMANPPIHIIVERGRITLTGTVSSQTDRMLAYALAQVDGALGVTNELTLDRSD
jgi:hyperosmotically inducible protein